MCIDIILIYFECILKLIFFGLNDFLCFCFIFILFLFLSFVSDVIGFVDEEIYLFIVIVRDRLKCI